MEFYRDLLGFRVFKVLSVKGKFLQRLLGRKGIKLTYAKLYGPNQPENSHPVFELHCWQKPKVLAKANYSHISLTAKNLDYEYRRLSRRGVRFISAPCQSPGRKTKICFAFDPDDNLIEFIEDLKNK